ncbi:MAG: hypothetical protein FWE22_01175 [Firmicutes bacterium]|nr:hypothetical protein [Bacillota bacterium]
MIIIWLIGLIIKPPLKLGFFIIKKFFSLLVFLVEFIIKLLLFILTLGRINLFKGGDG